MKISNNNQIHLTVKPDAGIKTCACNVKRNRPIGRTDSTEVADCPNPRRPWFPHGPETAESPSFLCTIPLPREARERSVT